MLSGVQSSAIAKLDAAALSPLLTLLDALVGHRTPLVSPEDVADADADAVLDVARENSTFGRFLSAVHRSLNATLDGMSLCLATRTLLGDRGPLTCLLLIDLNKGRAATRRQVLGYIREVEAQLAERGWKRGEVVEGEAGSAARIEAAVGALGAEAAAVLLRTLLSGR